MSGFVVSVPPKAHGELAWLMGLFWVVVSLPVSTMLEVTPREKGKPSFLSYGSVPRFSDGWTA